MPLSCLKNVRNCAYFKALSMVSTPASTLKVFRDTLCSFSQIFLMAVVIVPDHSINILLGSRLPYLWFWQWHYNASLTC
jgi:hypothetical protein